MITGFDHKLLKLRLRSAFWSALTDVWLDERSIKIILHDTSIRVILHYMLAVSKDGGGVLQSKAARPC